MAGIWAFHFLASQTGPSYMQNHLSGSEGTRAGAGGRALPASFTGAHLNT